MRVRHFCLLLTLLLSGCTYGEPFKILSKDDSRVLSELKIRNISGWNHGPKDLVLVGRLSSSLTELDFYSHANDDTSGLREIVQKALPTFHVEAEEIEIYKVLRASRRQTHLGAWKAVNTLNLANVLGSLGAEGWNVSGGIGVLSNAQLGSPVQFQFMNFGYRFASLKEFGNRPIEVTGEVNAYGSVALLLLMLGLPLVLSGVFQVWNRVNDRALAINDLKQEVAMEFACKVIPRVLLGEGIVCAALIMLPRWSALYDVWFGSEPRVGVNVATTSAFLILFSGFVLRTHLISRVLNTSSSSLVSARAQQYARLVTSSTNMVIAGLANIAFYMGLITEDPQNDLFVSKLALIAMTMNLVFLSNTPAQSRKHSTAN